MTPDKEIIDFVFAELRPTGGVTLLIDGSRGRWQQHVCRFGL